MPNSPTATAWLLSNAELLEPITEAEQRQDELDRLQAELDLLWARADDVQGHAEGAGHQWQCERICNRIAELKRMV